MVEVLVIVVVAVGVAVLPKVGDVILVDAKELAVTERAVAEASIQQCSQLGFVTHWKNLQESAYQILIMD